MCILFLLYRYDAENHAENAFFTLKKHIFSVIFSVIIS